ncbi:hypothetical protein [Streptomyces roseifaciens]|uniref:hypothetical protein n=1 Tax=Streptomyces roseifaciens TaxID=1488406 RepID=UPI00071800F4|nr:hypothetical protein [Streptomyces roseifaciens]
MDPRQLPRSLTGSRRIARGQDLARTAADSAADIFHPLIVIARGLRALAAGAWRKWAQTPGDRRGPTLLLVGSCIAIVALVPYGPALAGIALMTLAAWAGRDRGSAHETVAREGEGERLQALYEALVPYLSVPEDPAPLYAYDGDREEAFASHAFDHGGRLVSLELRYPAYFTDGEPESRARIEQLLQMKAGRGREYRFDWDEEANRLHLYVLPPLPADIFAQRFVTAPGESVLGFTDPGAVHRTLPVLLDGADRSDEPPVLWRTGQRSTEPHLLVLGRPAAGTSTLLRSLALQALQEGDVVAVDGSGSGEFAFLRGRDGVLAVESSPAGALAALEWATHETERRLLTANHARRQGHQTPEDVRRPLWILVDRPTALSHLAAGEGRTDPQELLQVPLRHGRIANVTVVVGDHLDDAANTSLLSEPVLTHTRARVVLGAVTADQVRSVLGAPPQSTPPPEAPAGRGYARLGSGPVHRMQVPSTPDPYDEDTSERERQAILALLPGLSGAAPTHDPGPATEAEHAEENYAHDGHPGTHPGGEPGPFSVQPT